MSEELNDYIKQVEKCYPMLLTCNEKNLEVSNLAAKDALDKFLNAAISINVLVKTHKQNAKNKFYFAQIKDAIKSIEYASEFQFCNERLSCLLRDVHDCLITQLINLEEVYLECNC